MYPNVHSSTIYSSQDIEATQMSIDRGMDKEDVVYIYDGMLLSHYKEWNNAICSSTYGPREYHQLTQSLSRVRLFVSPWTAACQASLSITNSQSLLKFMSIELVPSNHLVFCHPLLLLPSIFPSIRGFSNESVLHIRWPKYWSFNCSISPFNEHLGLISFRMDWLELLAVQGTLKSVFQHHSSKTSIL